MNKSVFRSDAARDRFRAQYQQILSQFPFGQQYIETSYGQTFVLSFGADTNPPVVLLHGSCSNSAFWFSEILGHLVIKKNAGRPLGSSRIFYSSTFISGIRTLKRVKGTEV